MTPERWQQIDRVFHAALTRTPDERAGFLTEACGDDEALRREVLSLLAADADAETVAGNARIALPAEAAAALLADRQPVAGQQIGHYRILSPLGAGGMGEVFLAQDARLGRKIALKLLPLRFTHDADRLRRFEQEAKAASALNHPNIITIHEIGEAATTGGEVHFIAMEFIDGQTLRQRLAEGRLELSEALEAAIQVASALAAAHEAGIVHRDVKPENLMVRPDGLVKVLDFGLAKLTETRTDEAATPAPDKIKTEPGTVMGTLTYMSPEQARGLELDARTDIFSLGVVLYEMLTGCQPFAGATRADVIAAILEKEPPPLRESLSAAPAELQRIVSLALMKDRAARYQTINDLSRDLKAFKHELEFEAKLKDHRPRAARPWPRAGLLAAGLAVMLLAAAGVYRYFTREADGYPGAITAVAVLPFANLSGNPEMEYLSDGLSESLINNLSQLPQLRVIARNSAFKYKRREVDPREVAAALGVEAVVTGRVTQRGDTLLIGVELVDARARTQMWGDQFTGKATDLLLVQSGMAREIAQKLRSRLTTAEQQQLIKRATDNSAAYELLLKGDFATYRGTAEGRKKAVEHYQQAVALDPNYARAYASLSAAYRLLGSTGTLDPKETKPKALAAALKAIELDERLPQGHYALAMIKVDDWDWLVAEREYKRALELNPNHLGARIAYSYLLSSFGQHEQAVAEGKRIRELDPLSFNTNSHLGVMYYFARQYDQAIETYKKVLELDPNYFFVHLYLAYAHAAKGDYPEAIAAYQQTIKQGGDSPGTQVYLGYAYARSGQRDAALAILQQLQTSKEYVSPGELAILHAGLGEKDQALALLEKAYAERDLQLQYLGVEPHYDSLRGDPRFQDLLRRVGLAQ